MEQGRGEYVSMETYNEKKDDDDDMDSSDLDSNTPSVENWFSWWIAGLVLIGHILYYGISWTVGVYHIIFLDVFQQPAWSTSFIGSLNTASLYFFAPFGGVLVSFISCRTLVMTGTAIVALGLLLSFWATNIYILYLTFGIMGGGGAGLAFIPIITIVARYFDRRRALAIGLASSGVGLGVLIIPSVIQLLNDTFGWRGSLMMLSAILAQFIALAATMKPIKRPEDDEIHVCEQQRQQSCLQHLRLDICRERRYQLLCLSNLLLMYGTSVVYVHMAAYARTEGLKHTSWLYIALGVSTTVGRIFFGVIGQWRKLPFVLVYCAALIFGGLPVVVLPHVTGTASIMAVATAFGFGTAVIGPYLPQLCIMFLGIENMSAAYGYLLVFEGSGTLLGAPSAGSLFDQTQIYDYSFYVGGCSIILSGLVMLPAWRWVQPSAVIEEIIEEECSQLSLNISRNDVHKKVLSRMSHLTLNQSMEVVAASLSRAASRSDLNMNTSLISLHNSRISLPRSFSSRLTLHSLQNQHNADVEKALVADS